MNLKSSIHEYTEAEFLEFVNLIFLEISLPEHKDFNRLVCHFSKIVEHPEGSDLIFYSSEENYSPEAIMRIIKQWFVENNKPGFKPSTED